MYNIDYFSYHKEPIVKIKTIGIYPLDDEGRAKYYSKDSFNYHYLRQTDPFVFKQILGMGSNNNQNEEKEEESDKIPTIPNIKKEAAITKDKKYEETKTQPNQDFIKNKINCSLKNNTISTNRNTNRLTLNQRYMNSINKKKKLKKLENLGIQSFSRSFKKNYLLTPKPLNEEKDLRKMLTINQNGHRRMIQSFDKNAHLSGLTMFKNRMGKTTPKLPLIMGGFNHDKSYTIKNIRADSKEMGERYNPYNFIPPHVNRTKRNYLGGLFHC